MMQHTHIQVYGCIMLMSLSRRYMFHMGEVVIVYSIGGSDVFIMCVNIHVCIHEMWVCVLIYEAYKISYVSYYYVYFCGMNGVNSRTLDNKYIK